MKIHLFNLTICLLTVALFGCKKPGQAPAPGTPPEGPGPVTPNLPAGVVRDRGTATTAPRVYQIGGGGGELESADGRMVVTIPAGALVANTAFTIAAVTNTLPGSFGRAYRIAAENVQLAKPLTIRYHWLPEGIDSTAPEALFLACQQAGGIWQMATKTLVNKTNKTLTVTTRQMGDWAPFALCWLSRSTPVTPLNQPVHFSVYTTENFSAIQPSHEMLDIAAVKQLNSGGHLHNWQLQGGGRLDAAANGTTAVYTAPAALPAVNPVGITVALRNFLPAGLPDRGPATSAQFSSSIKILGQPQETFFQCTVNNTPFNATTLHWYYLQPGVVNIEGRNAAGDQLTITIHMGPQLKWGSYGWYMEPNLKLAQMTYAPANDLRYFSGYVDCNRIPFYSDGSVGITRIDDVGGQIYLMGNFNARVYEEGHCNPVTSKRVEGLFRVGQR